jgi:glyceraldehyde 3-phosphate dehydrogenase
MTKIGINGFGRIGRCIFRALLAKEVKDIQLVAINDITEAQTLAYLLKYDSIHGELDQEIKYGPDFLSIGGREIKVLKIKEPSSLPWRELEVEVVLECTGLFRDRKSALLHLNAGASKVIISAPAKEPDITIAMGINHHNYQPSSHHIISAASCTTNCLAPVVKVLNDCFGIIKGQMTTIHAYTNDQRVLDLPHKDLRRARAAGLSMIPTTTGAARAISLVLPEMKNKLDGVAIRVPVANVSIVDLTAILKASPQVEDINLAFQKAAKEELKGILAYTEEPLVSRDFNGNPHSAIVDGTLTSLVDKNMVKVFAWYDNEWGFANRMIELADMIGAKL